MKKIVLSGIAFAMSLNSVAFAESSRVSQVASQTQAERDALVTDLRNKVIETRAKLAELKMVLPEVVAKRNKAAFASLGNMLGAAITGVLTVTLATKVPSLKGFVKTEGMVGTVVLGAWAGLYSKLTYDTTIESTYLADEELQIIADIKKMDQEITDLDAELANLLQQLGN